MSAAQEYRRTQKIGDYVENWESLDDDEKSYAWKQMDAGLKSYIRGESDDDWEDWTYTPDEWNEMSDDEREANWEQLPDYEKTFLAEEDEYDTNGLAAPQEDTEGNGSTMDNITDAMYGSGHPGMMAAGAAADAARYGGTDLLNALEETMKDHAMDYVSKVGKTRTRSTG